MLSFCKMFKPYLTTKTLFVVTEPIPVVFEHFLMKKMKITTKKQQPKHLISL